MNARGGAFLASFTSKRAAEQARAGYALALRAGGLAGPFTIGIRRVFTGRGPAWWLELHREPPPGSSRTRSRRG